MGFTGQAGIADYQSPNEFYDQKILSSPSGGLFDHFGSSRSGWPDLPEFPRQHRQHQSERGLPGEF